MFDVVNLLPSCSMRPSSNRSKDKRISNLYIIYYIHTINSANSGKLKWTNETYYNKEKINLLICLKQISWISALKSWNKSLHFKIENVLPVLDKRIKFNTLIHKSFQLFWCLFTLVLVTFSTHQTEYKKSARTNFQMQKNRIEF